MRPVGYYVHHQGAGHWHRARALGALLSRPCTLIGTLAAFDRRDAPGPVLDLPDDRPVGGGFDGRDGVAGRPLALHYAPLNHPGVRVRMGRIAQWIAESDPALMIVDVSAEVAMLARLLSAPTLVVRLAGERTDPAHLEAFRGAARLLAPFPRALDGASVPGWITEKTIYGGFLGAPVGRHRIDLGAGAVAVVLGQGGARRTVADLAAAARAVPDRSWHVLGPVAGTGGVPPNLHLHGWVEEPAAYAAGAALLVGGGGDGVVALAAALGKRFLCLPEPRPYAEQIAKARALSALGAAVVHEDWPEPEAWAALVHAGLNVDPSRIAALHEVGATTRCAAEIDALADAADRGTRGRL